jgi:hypothetical protein
MMLNFTGIAQNYEKFDPIRDIKKNSSSSDNEVK